MMAADTDFAGSVALVTGGTTGIGLATAARLACGGAAVTVVSNDVNSSNAAVDEITATGAECLAFPADVTDETDVIAAVSATVDRFGHLDIVVSSAGIQRYGTATETSQRLWDEVFDVNVKGAFLTSRTALPHLRQRPSSAIVVVSSVQAYVAQAGVVAYSASKGALNAMVRAMAIDEAEHGVRVNGVCPGSVDTPMLRWAAAQFGDGSPEAVERLVSAWGAAHPLGRVARPDEVAEVIAFLAGPKASFVSGEDVRVDGGLLATVGVTLPK